MSYYNPYRAKAIQNQQKAQSKSQAKTQQQQPARQQVRDDFGDEWVGKEVESEVVKGANVTVLRGRVAGVSRYWLKMAVDGQTIYVNKAFILSIKPLEMKDGVPGGPNAGGQSARQ
jgi:hypothetical protein